ncbi:MAG: Gfo/Idh/MocA family oxidoreductase, partial [Candidatus Brocadiae bacterium]|nr:Gfo/Idh/MocA family oxidoreductase [Candidatus Brocadiia bacterium]
MPRRPAAITRRRFLQGTSAAAGLAIVPRHVLGGEGKAPPSDTFACGLVGCGGQGGEDIRTYINHSGGQARILACCDVERNRLASAVKKFGADKGYTDFRRLVERNDLDVVSVATPPHWHALIAIAAMEAGKDVLCEKPMTKFIAEGRAVVNAATRYGRVFQIGTGGRYGAIKSKRSRMIHNAMRSGLLTDCKGAVIKRGGLAVRRYLGRVNLQPEPAPTHLDWDMYCGPAPLRPFNRHRHGWSHRFYWDYEGGGLTDLAPHWLDPMQWIYAKDHTSPVEIEAHAPPAHPECASLWGWVELKYADGFTFVLDGKEWGKPYDRKPERHVALSDLDEEGQKKVQAMPDPAPLIPFPEAVRTRKRAGGHAEAAHRAVTVCHLANIAIRMGRTIRYDPVAEQIVGDDEANRLVNQPM